MCAVIESGQEDVAYANQRDERRDGGRPCEPAEHPEPGQDEWGEASFVRLPHGVVAIIRVELRNNLCDVVLRGAEGDAEAFGYLLVCQALAYKGQDLPSRGVSPSGLSVRRLMAMGLTLRLL